jgi:hypothetical protein
MTYHICIYSNVVLFITSKGARGTESPPPFLTFCSYIHFQYNFFISLLFHHFFLIWTWPCPYSYNLMLRATYMCRRLLYIGSTHVKRFRKMGWVSIPPKFIKVLWQSFRCRFTRSKNFDKVLDVGSHDQRTLSKF